MERGEQGEGESGAVIQRLSKPRIFIGSSRERLNLAKAVQNNIFHSGAAFALPWYQGVFQGNGYALDDLLNNAVNQCDFAIFIFHPDDIAQIRQHTHAIVRDNVILELGMFYGRLGRERTFFVAPRDVDHRTPSDLFGLEPIRYDWDPSFEDGNFPMLQAAVGAAWNTIEEHVNRLGSFEDPAAKLIEVEKQLEQKLQLARFQNETVKAIRWMHIDYDWLLHGLIDGFDKKCDIINTHVRISGASLYEREEGNTFKRSGRTGHAAGPNYGETSADRLSEVLASNELLLTFDEEQSKSLVAEVEYQLIVPIDNREGIVVIIHFRMNHRLKPELEQKVMQELYENNVVFFAAVKTLFGRRVSNGAEVIQGQGPKR